MYDRHGNRMSARELNDDGVVYLLCTVFGLYDGYERMDIVNENGVKDTMGRLFGGQCQHGNSHNGDYQLGLNMTRLALRKYTGKLTK